MTPIQTTAVSQFSPVNHFYGILRDALGFLKHLQHFVLTLLVISVAGSHLLGPQEDKGSVAGKFPRSISKQSLHQKQIIHLAINNDDLVNELM